jgi:hypothetical protein
MNLDPDALRPTIIEMNGDIRSIAARLSLDSEELRSFIMNTPLLRRALDEVISRGVDQSLTVLFDGLEDNSVANRIAAAKVFLKSRAAQRRGFSPSPDLELKMPKQGGALTLTWLPPAERPEPRLIEGKIEDE